MQCCRCPHHAGRTGTRASSASLRTFAAGPASTAWPVSKPQQPGHRWHAKRKPMIMAAAAAAEHGSVTGSEVVAWLSEVSHAREDAREVLRDMLIAEPLVLSYAPRHLCAITELLLTYTKKQRLYTHWFFPAHVLCNLAERWGPTELKARLRALDAAAYRSLDGLVECGDLLAACADKPDELLAMSPEQLDMCAASLRELVPEFTPATVLRAVPEVLQLPQDELCDHIARAGDLVAVGWEAGLQAELLLNPPDDLHPQPPQQACTAQMFEQAGHVPVKPSTTPPQPGAVRRRRATACSAAQMSHPGSRVRLRHGAGCDHSSDQQLVVGARTAVRDEQLPEDDVLCVITNSRQLVYVNNRCVEVRFDDPHRQEEALRAAGAPHLFHHGYTPRSWLMWPSPLQRSAQYQRA